MSYFENALRNLENIGLLDVILPFILIFTVVFAVLQKTKILGKDKDGHPHKNFNVIISLVMALGVVIPHVNGSYGRFDIVDIINGALPNISLIIVAILMVLLLIGVFGKELNIEKSNFGGWIIILSFVIVIYIFVTEAGWVGLPRWLNFLRDPSTQAAVITILVFGLVIWFITKEDKSKDPKSEGFMKGLTKMLESGGKEN